jgi:hypothetical protein
VRSTLAVVTCALASAMLVAGAAAAAPLPGSPDPLPGSAFQGGDGDQADGSGHADWQAFEAARRVVHSADPNAADSAFGGGTKENEPGEWAFRTEAGGVNPGKDNILDAWSAVDQPAGDTFFYLAFARAEKPSGNGTTSLAFELNQDARKWNNGNAEIPCRRTGDLLVVFDVHGNAIDVVLQTWTTTHADPGSGCATLGHLDVVATNPDGAAQGAVNVDAIHNFLPGQAPSSIGVGQFGEAALNLTSLLESAFGRRCFMFGSVWMHSRSSTSDSAQMQDYVAPRRIAVRQCAASGIKYLDQNANGHRDRGEPGIPRFLIWADYNDDGVRTQDEPFAISDDRGRYVIADIQPPDGSYTLRETLLSKAAITAWRCSEPNASTGGGFANGPGSGLFGCGWGPIRVATTAYARNRNFGNWLPAQLTVEKQLWPPDDPGRFDLKVNGRTVVAAAGDGATSTIFVPPGSYHITETAVPPTDPAEYESSVSCTPTRRRRSQRRKGAAYAGLVLRAGGHAKCTFVNVRPRVPAIAIEKTGPVSANAGDTLRYRFSVTNPGEIPLRASTVRVTDTQCDEPPALVRKLDGDGPDRSPRTLDPGDTWIYTCTNEIPPPTSDCAISTVTNTATVTGEGGGTTVSDDDSLTTTLECPDQPPDPALPEPLPGEVPSVPAPNPTPTPPAPVAPAGPTPPSAGNIAVAGIHVRGRRGDRGCITRASQLRLVGTRIGRIRVSVDGRRASRRTLQLLQRRATLLPRLFGAGRHRVTVRVGFQRGAGAPPVTLTRTVTVCSAQRPQFTG